MTPDQEITMAQQQIQVTRKPRPRPAPDPGDSPTVNDEISRKWF